MLPLQMNLIGRRSRRADGQLLKGLLRLPKRKYPWQAEIQRLSRTR